MKKILFILTLLLSLNGFAQFPIPGTEGFESTTGPNALPSTNWTLGTGNWAVFDNGVGLGQRWGINNGITTPPLVYAGTNAAYINRENIGIGNTSEDYLATPLVTVPTNGQLRFFSRTFSNGNTGTLYQVKVAPATATQTNIAGYTTQIAEYTEDQLTLDMNGVQNAFNVYTEKVISFPASMIGTNVYVAFVMKYTQTTTTISGDRWLLDNVRVAQQCLNPTGLVATGVLSNQASLSWANPSGATSWEIEIIPATATPTGTGIIYNGSLPYLATGLTPNTAYKYYVRALCPDNIPSEWVGPTTFSTTTAPPICGGNFLDPGGVSNYADNITAANGTTTICPINATDLVTVNFTSFSTEGCCDFLSIYDGNSSSSPLIGIYGGTNSPGEITSSAPGGCLTFVFTTDSSVVDSGWFATITCAPAPTCPKPTFLVSSGVTHNSGTISFTNNSTATNFQYLAVPCGSPAPTNGVTGTVGVATTSNPITITGLNPDTCYTVYVRAICSTSDYSDWSLGTNFTTQLIPPVCGGIFTDLGGSFGNYPDNVTAEQGTTTICPLNATQMLTVDFTTFLTWDGLGILNIYDGNSSSAPLIGTYTGTNSPGTVTASLPGGCLTFVFTSQFVGEQGWTANVICNPAPTCPRPTFLTASTVTSNSAQLSFTNNSSATSFQYLAVPCGSPAPTNGLTGTAGTLFTTNPITITGLNPDTCYTIYVRALCSATDYSNWSNGTNITTQLIPPACGGIFTDSGGSANVYQDGEFITTTICPINATDLVTVNFTSFSTEGCCDFLSVYDGNSSTAPFLGTFGGTNSPGEITSSAPGGCLTFVFSSDSSVVSSGWTADVTCAPAPTCPKPTALIASGITFNSGTLSFTNNSTATNFEYLVLPCGSPAPTNGISGTLGTATTSNPISITGLNPDTCYTLYVRAICSSTDYSNWSLGLNITTQLIPPACGGIFTDLGGSFGNYPSDLTAEQGTTTICPLNATQILSVNFTSFSTWDGLGILNVYDGSSSSAPLIGTYSGTNSPGLVSSSVPGGCLTFVFTSQFISDTGWTANVICNPAPTCPTPAFLNVSSITSNSGTLTFVNSSTATNFQYLAVPCGSPIPTNTTVGIATSTYPISITGLIPNTCYTVYVRAICSSTDSSAWSAGFNMTTQVAPPVCGGNFLDPGILANYNDNTNVATLICPSLSTNKVTVTFTSFNTEENNDILYVYNGNNATAPLIGTYSGNTIPESITSSASTGCLYFVFISNNNNITGTGWSSNVTCAPPASCPKPLGFTSTQVITDSTQLSWIEAGSATSWQILVQPCGTPNPTSTTTGWTTVSSSPYTITGLSPNCCNEYYIRSVCSGTETSQWTKVYNNDDGNYVVWTDNGSGNSITGTYPGGTVTVSLTGTGNAVGISSPGFDFNLDTTGANTFQTFGPTSNPPSQDLTFTFSTPVIVSRYTMADIDLGAGGWNDTFNFVGITFTSTTSENLLTTTTGAVATSDVSGNGEFGNWYMSTTPVTSFSLDYSVTDNLTHAYLAYAMKVFIPCPPVIPPTLTVSVNSPTQCQGTTATVTATPNTAGTYTYTWTVPSGVTNPGNVATFTTTIGGNYSVVITNTVTGISSPSSSGTVTFNPIIIPTFNSISNICQNSVAPSLPTTSNNGIIGTWNPSVINSAIAATTTYTFTPNTSISGQQCAIPTTINVTVAPILTPTFTPINNVCFGADINPLPTTSLNGVTGTWSPALNNTATTTYTFTPNLGQCAVSTTIQIQVIVCDLNIYASAVWMQDCTTTGDGKFFNTTGAGTDLINPDGSNFAINYGVHVQNSASLLLRGAEIKTQKSGSSNICDARMNYRVFPTATVPGAFTPWNLPFYSDCNTTLGVFNVGGGPCSTGQQKWQCVSQAGCTPALDLTTLAPGQYTIQVYYDINGSFTTTTGCTDNLVLNNGGNYYVANFTIQAPASVTSTNPTTCGGTNGTITISNLATNATYSITYSDDTLVSTPTNYTSDATGNIVISGLNSGVYTNFSMTINNCTTNLSNLVILTDPALPTVSVNNSSICSTGTATVTATPISSGTYNYAWTVPATATNPGNVNSFTTQVGGTFSVIITDTTTNCSSASATGIVTILPDVTMALGSANNVQTLCVNTPISSIVYNTTNGATNVTSSGLPTGVTGTFNSGIYTITGTPTLVGTYNYSVTTSGGCGSVTLNGTINVSPNVTMNLTSGSNNQTVCINTAIATIAYTTGNGATNVTSSGLPSGVTGVYNAGVYTITGTPTLAGTYNYSVTTSGGCSSATLSGTITVNSLTLPTFTFGTATTICQNGAVETLVGTSSNGFSGTWSPSVINNVTSGVYTFTPNAGQCASTTTYTVTVQNAFDFEFESGCIGDNFTLQANPIANGYDENTATYSWVYNSNVVGTDESFDVTSYLLSTSVNETLPITFYLTITRADGCSTTKPIDVTNVYCGIQKGISPNNDTLNDFFDLTLLNVEKLEIYNRYGMKVYSKSNYVDQWKGQSDKGDELPDGTYYYVIQFKNNQPTKTGWIYINREY